MYKLAKWAYRRGVMAERNRIKRLIAEHRQMKPERPESKSSLENYDRALEVWYRVGDELGRLTDPSWGKQVEMQQIAPIDIDEDSL